jgi:hypothetical protein
LVLEPGGIAPHGIKINKPALVERPSHRLQRGVHPAVQFDLFVQRAEDVSDEVMTLSERVGNR